MVIGIDASRIENNEKSIVYSGDTDYSNEIIKISKNVDLIKMGQSLDGTKDIITFGVQKLTAGTDNFSVSYKGDVHGCIKEMPAGNIINDTPEQIYYGEFAHARKKASTCKENCHFLVNCLYDVQEKKNQIINMNI